MTKSTSLVLEIEGHRLTLTESEWTALDCIQTGMHQYHILEDGIAHTIDVEEFDLAARRCVLKVDGERKEISYYRDLDLLIEIMGLNSARSKKSDVLQAPMPGLVTGIKVNPGQAVEKGTPILILEAMKMENVITAPHQALIKSIHVSVGQAVDKGAKLVEFSA